MHYSQNAGSPSNFLAYPTATEEILIQVSIVLLELLQISLNTTSTSQYELWHTPSTLAILLSI
jgi:hypothetical protein